MHRPIGRLSCRGGGEVHFNEETDQICATGISLYRDAGAYPVGNFKN